MRGLVFCAALLWSSVPLVAQEVSWLPAVDRLLREKVLAEGCASLLKSFAEDAPMARVQGQRLYARAKADMDGLVALLVADVAGERSPADIPELRQRLEVVPAQRRALCRHVDRAVGTALRQLPAGAHASDLLSAGSGDAASPMIEAAVQIWQAYHLADQAVRATIASRIAGTRWLAYAEVPRR